MLFLNLFRHKDLRETRPVRFERTTFGLGNRCSILLSYGRNESHRNGAPIESRPVEECIGRTLGLRFGCPDVNANFPSNAASSARPACAECEEPSSERTRHSTSDKRFKPAGQQFDAQARSGDCAGHGPTRTATDRERVEGSRRPWASSRSRLG